MREGSDDGPQPAQTDEGGRCRAGEGGHRRGRARDLRGDPGLRGPRISGGRSATSPRGPSSGWACKQTRQRNGVLFFLVPSRRRFVVLGDEGIHAKVGQDFWDGLASILAAHFRKGEFTEGLVRAIGEAGAKLAAHFPYDAATDTNELPDDIDFGK